MADMSERMISKGGLQDLLQGASLVGRGTEKYYLETSDNEDETLRTLRKKIASKIWSHEWTMLAYGSDVSTDPLEAQFLKTLSTMERPCRTLVIGTIGSGTGQYYLENNDNECEVMRTRREKIASKIWGHEWLAKRTLFTDGPDVSTDLLEAQFLKVHSTMKQTCLTLEIGMFTGYGAAVMLMDSGYTKLFLIEIDQFLKPWGSRVPDIDDEHIDTPQDRGRAHS